MFQELRHLAGSGGRGQHAERCDHLGSQVAIQRGFGQQLAAVAQVQPHPMKLARSDLPVTRDLGTENHLRYQVAPNQRLSLGGYEEVLFGFGQSVGKGG